MLLLLSLAAMTSAASATYQAHQDLRRRMQPYVWVNSRFNWFSELKNEQMDPVLELGYTEDTWNLIGSNPIENVAFSELDPDQQAAASSLGYTEDKWDCETNHYTGYDWSELEEYGLDKHWEALGWSKCSWDRGCEAPATAAMEWQELDGSQQKAMEEVCYFQESWDGVSLVEWIWDDDVGTP